MDIPDYLAADLIALRGRMLSSVTFVMDYLSLQFDDPVLTCFMWPEVVGDAGSLHFGMSGYRDALCDLIATTVAEVQVTPDLITISLDKPA